MSEQDNSGTGSMSPEQAMRRIAAISREMYEECWINGQPATHPGIWESGFDRDLATRIYAEVVAPLMPAPPTITEWPPKRHEEPDPMWKCACGCVNRHVHLRSLGVI